MPQTIDELPLATLPPGERPAAVLRRARDLSPGAAVLLTADADPAPVLQGLQAEFAGAFDWWPLERGPGRWRIILSRVTVASARPRTITNVMCADHVRLDQLYGRLYRALESEDLDWARTWLAEFRLGIERHMEAEETILMPLMVERGGVRGPRDAEQMHEEHARILAALDAAEAAVTAAEPGAAQTATEALTTMRFVLEGHNQNEERLLYPISDRETDDTERADIIARIQAI